MNKYTPQFEPRDVLDLLVREVFISLNCHGIGKVESVDYAKRTVVVSLAYQKTMNVLNTNGTYEEKPFTHPPLMDLPFLVLGGGNAELRFPIVKGDECIVFFNDRDINNWFLGSPPVPPPTARLHSFSDGIALVGLRSLARPGTAFDPLRAVLANGTTYVGVSATHVKIANATLTLNTLIASLITAIEGIIIDVNSVGPGGGTVSPASVAALEAVKTQIAGLLE